MPPMRLPQISGTIRPRRAKETILSSNLSVRESVLFGVAFHKKPDFVVEQVKEPKMSISTAALKHTNQLNNLKPSRDYDGEEIASASVDYSQNGKNTFAPQK